MKSTQVQTVRTDLLRTLHRIHRQLTDLQARLERGPRVLAVHQANIDKLQGKYDEVLKKKQKLATDAKNRQLELETNEKKVAARRQQLMEAKDNKAYQALVDQIAADEMANSVLADETLELIEKSDMFDETVEQAKKELDEVIKSRDEAKQKFDDTEPQIRQDVERLLRELADYESQVPAEVLETYRRHVRNQGQDAMAEVEGSFCSGCNQQIPANTINGLMLEKMTLCKSCGRILYLPEGYEPR